MYLQQFSDLYHLELERLRGEVVVEAEVELAALLRGVPRLDVHVHQRHRAVVPERKLREDQSIKILRRFCGRIVVQGIAHKCFYLIKVTLFHWYWVAHLLAD